MKTAYTPGPWSTPHFAMDDVGCDCASVLAEQYMGAVAQVCIGVDLPLGDGGNDCPPLEEAKANARLIAVAPELLQLLQEAYSVICKEVADGEDAPLAISIRELVAKVLP